MSKEHLWPEWMAPFIPKGANDIHRETWDTYDVVTPVRPTQITDRQGHVTTKKLKKVCISCNNGWMSRIEDHAKPYLLPMMYGQGINLDVRAQKAVIDWIVLKCMVFENNRREDAATTLGQRARFMDLREIPTYTQIHIFKCGESPWDWQFHRHSAGMTSVSPPTPVHPRVKNTQTFAIAVGHLLIYVLQAFAADIEFSFERIAARQIWPPIDNVVTWPAPLTCTAFEAERIAENMTEFIREQEGRG
jgi:hypothetical protein